MAGEANKGDDAATTTSEYNFTGRQVTSRSLKSGVENLESKAKTNLLLASDSRLQTFNFPLFFLPPLAPRDNVRIQSALLLPSWILMR